jgi:CHRD domain-containing protein
VNRRTTQAVAAGVIALLLAAAGVSVAGADRGGGDFDARLSGYEETPQSISTTGNGRFEAEVDRGSQTIDYVLSYRDIEGGAVSAAHIHFGRRATSGGVSAFLCGGGDKPPCPQGSGTVEGTIDPADIIGPAGQGIEPGSFDELVRAMEAGATYANVHSMRWPGGEIRGQIRGEDDD